MPKEKNLFTSRRFLPLFITQFLGAFNDNAFKNAFLIWFTYDVSVYHGLNAPLMVTLASGLFILPFFLFSAMAGQICDKYEKSWLTQKIKLAEIILMLACGFFFNVNSIMGLLLVLFLMGVQSTFFGPIKYSLLPEHLLEKELVSGNAYIEAGTFLSILLGTIFGGLIILTEYGKTLLTISVLLFAVVGYGASFFIPKSIVGDPQIKIDWNIFGQTNTIINYVRKEKVIWLAILGISWFWLIGVSFLTQFPTYTKDIIGGNEHLVTLFLTLFSVGIGIGSMLCNSLLQGKISTKLIPYGCLGMSFAILLFVFCSALFQQHLISLSHASSTTRTLLSITDFFHMHFSSYGIVCSLLILSIFGGIYIVPLYAIMQHYAEPAHMARVIAANNIINAIFMVLASILAFALFAIHFSSTDLFLTLAFMNLVVFLYIYTTLKQGL